MADNYLEKHYEDFLKRKAAWEKNKGKAVRNRPSVPEEPEDESL